jgi:hypothetical protein
LGKKAQECQRSPSSAVTPAWVARSMAQTHQPKPHQPKNKRPAAARFSPFASRCPLNLVTSPLLHANVPYGSNAGLLRLNHRIPHKEPGTRQTPVDGLATPPPRRATKKAASRPMNGTRHSLLYLNPPADCDEWSRCETGVDQACFCTCRQAIQANAKMLVPLPEWRPEGLESLLR